MTNKQHSFTQQLIYIGLCAIGGLLLELFGLSIGWMIGTLLVATTFSINREKWSKESLFNLKMPTFWTQLGQLIFGIHLGQRLTLSVFDVFYDHWFLISLTLVISIVVAMITGLILWKHTVADLMTSFYGTAPGGITTMVTIGEEEGGNVAIISIVQSMRKYLVLLLVPLFVASLNGGEALASASYENSPSILLTAFMLIVSLIFAYLGKLIHAPARWIVMPMVGVALFKGLISVTFGYDVVLWWPHAIFVFAQISLGASIGSRINKDMFAGMGKVALVSFGTTLLLIATTLISAFVITHVTDITFITALLAFAPGGIAEMAATAILVGADSVFVVTVQVIRIMIVLMVLPVLFRKLFSKKGAVTRTNTF